MTSRRAGALPKRVLLTQISCLIAQRRVELTQAQLDLTQG